MGVNVDTLINLAHVGIERSNQSRRGDDMSTADEDGKVVPITDSRADLVGEVRGLRRRADDLEGYLGDWKAAHAASKRREERLGKRLEELAALLEDERDAHAETRADLAQWRRMWHVTCPDGVAH